MDDYLSRIGRHEVRMAGMYHMGNLLLREAFLSCQMEVVIIYICIIPKLISKKYIYIGLFVINIDGCHTIYVINVIYATLNLPALIHMNHLLFLIKLFCTCYWFLFLSC